MALHEVIEKHKVNILGQEITYKNKFLVYKEGTSYGFKPQSSLISHASRLFKYDYEHHMPPTLYTSHVDGQKYIVPSWQKVHPDTQLSDINWIKPEPKVVESKETSTLNEEYKFESKSEPGSFYVVRVIGDKVKCNCAGQYRAKDRQCKHMKEVKQKLGL